MSEILDEEKPLEKKVGQMHKRRVLMPDEKRYLIYYTFGDEPTQTAKSMEVQGEAEK